MSNCSSKHLGEEYKLPAQEIGATKVVEVGCISSCLVPQLDASVSIKAVSASSSKAKRRSSSSSSTSIVSRTLVSFDSTAATFFSLSVSSSPWIGNCRFFLRLFKTVRVLRRKNEPTGNFLVHLHLSGWI